jgi:hypothetical protein
MGGLAVLNVAIAVSGLELPLITARSSDDVQVVQLVPFLS